MGALGEMTSYSPMSRGFGGYASRFVHPALGFVTGYSYLCKYLLATPNQLTAFALIIQFWTGDSFNPGVFITVAFVLVLILNSFNVKFFGEFEFWMSSFKVVALIGIMLVMLVIACGGAPNGKATGFNYWSKPGAFAEYKATGATGRFVGLWSAMIQAVYAYGGTELVGVTSAEAKDPRRGMARAVKLTFYRILIFYVLSVFLLGMVVPYDSPELVFAQKASTSAAASPFVVAIRLAHIPVLDHIINACMLLFVLSAAISDFYIATLTLFNIAQDNKAPRIFRRTSEHGVPYVAMIVTSAFCLLAYMSVSSGAKAIFGYLTSMVAVFGMLTWISILTTHIFFIRAVRAQNVPLNRFPYRASLGLVGSLGGALFLGVLILTKGFSVFVDGFDWRNFIVQYIGLPCYLILLFGYMFITKTKRVRSRKADVWTNTEVVREKSAEEEEGPYKKSALPHFYRKYISFMF